MSLKKLSKQRIVDEAVAYIAETEKPEIPIRELANRLGVKAPSLYNHIKNANELQYAVSKQAIGLFVKNLREATTGKSKDAAIKSFAAAYRSFAMENKGIYRLIMSIPSKEDDVEKEIALPLLDTVMSILSEYDLPKEVTAHWQRVFRSILHGFVSQEYLGSFFHYKDADIDESFDIAIQCFLDGLNAE